MLIQGDARHLPLADNSVDCVVTSPPYFGLRDYGVPGQIGLEATPDAYIAEIVQVFREVRRVLKDDGTLWLNLGDSYAGGKVGRSDTGEADLARRAAAYRTGGGASTGPREAIQRRAPDGYEAKDLLMIPARVAIALQADGWYLRCDVVWNKPNVQPESVTDRPTRSHEYVFLLSKSDRYYFDRDAIKEPVSGTSHSRGSGVNPKALLDAFGTKQNESFSAAVRGLVEFRNKRSVWTIPTRPYTEAHFATMPEALVEPCVLAGCRPTGRRCDCDAVIATPLGEDQIEDPTLLTGRAGFNRPRVEGQGVRPMTRREQRSYAEQLRRSPFRAAMAAAAGESAFEHYIRTDRSGARAIPPQLLAAWREAGWLQEPAPCRHPIEPAGIVLDPFFGSGTVGQVAERLGRRWVGVDLGYHDLSKERTAQLGLSLPMEMC